MLASQKMPPELNSVLNDVVKVINHIKANALNSRLFTQLCEEMDTEHRRLLLYRNKMVIPKEIAAVGY